MAIDDPIGEPGKAAREHWSRVISDAHEATRPAAKAHTVDTLRAFLDTIEEDLKPHLRGIVAPMLADPTTPDVLRPLLAELGEPEHAGATLIFGIALGSILSPVFGAALAPLVQGIANVAWEKDPSIHISPLEAAHGVLKGVFDQAHGAGIAAFSGINDQNFDHLVKIAGNAIGFEEALLLDRRGQLEGVTLRDVLEYSNVNPRFYASALNLKYRSPSIGTVITGALKSHLERPEALKLYEEAGGNPDHYDWEKASAGRPLGLEQMLHLLNRKKMTEQDVRDGIAQSDINNDYVDFALELQHYFPPPRSVVPMLHNGAIDEAQARKLLGYYGVDDEWSDAFVKEAQHTTGGSVKELGAAQVIRGYEQKLFTRADAIARLELLHYSAANATLYIDIADAMVEDRLRDSAVAKIHSRYIVYKITKPEANADLARLDLPPEAVAQLLQFWDDERTTNVPILTMSQAQQGYHRGVLTLDQFVAIAHERGFTGVSVKVLAAEAWPASKVPPEVWALPPASPGHAAGPALTINQGQRALERGAMSLAEFIALAKSYGYAGASIKALAAAAYTSGQVPKAVLDLDPANL